jgi:dihydrofolate synthase/folylpolyglutamate synthase
MPEPPRSVVETARDLGTSLKVRGHDFDSIPRSNSQWDFAGQRGTLAALPLPALPGQTQVGNAATVLAALEQLGRRVDVDRLAVEQGLRTVELPGRFQRLADPRGFEWILDVAHNPDSARVLAGNLAHFPARGRTLAVCAMLGDKDVAHVLGELRTTVDEWFAAGTEGPRGLSDVQLAERAKGAGIDTIAAGTVIEAMTRAAAAAGEGDRIVVFGSFHTVGPALSALQDHL